VLGRQAKRGADNRGRKTREYGRALTWYWAADGGLGRNEEHRGAVGVCVDLLAL
jgi:hypothetical protein